MDDILARPDFYFSQQSTPNLHLQQANILVVSTEAVHDYFTSIASTVEETTDSVLFLHFGVFAAAKCYQIEQRAYNDATFRAPDECQFQPQQMPISLILQQCALPCDANSDTSHYCSCVLNMDALVSKTNQTCVALEHVPLQTLLSQKQQVAAFNVENKQTESEIMAETQFCIPSVDAGRYLCNYIYYTSFMFGKHQPICQNKPAVYNLFVHVPSQSTVPMPEQFKFVRALLHAISCLFD